MIEKIYKKAIYALARVAVKYIELRKKREQKKKRRGFWKSWMNYMELKRKGSITIRTGSFWSQLC